MPKYNVVIASFSVLKNARDSYLLLKNEGYPSLIFWDANKNVYRIIIGSTKKKKDAISLLSMYKQTYPDAWILYVYKGKVKEKYNNNESSGIWNDVDYNVLINDIP